MMASKVIGVVVALVLRHAHAALVPNASTHDRKPKNTKKRKLLARSWARKNETNGQGSDSVPPTINDKRSSIHPAMKELQNSELKTLTERNPSSSTVG